MSSPVDHAPAAIPAGVLDQLITKLETATGPDREIDRHLATVAGYKVKIFRVPAGHPVFKEGGGLEFMSDDDGINVGVPPYTASIDATEELAERVLPSHEWGVGPDFENGRYWAGIGSDVWDECCDAVTAHAKTGALALCLAICKALLRIEAGRHPASSAEPDNNKQEGGARC